MNMKKRMMILAAGLAAVFIILGGTYVGIGMHYTTHFFENTSINGIYVGDMTAAQAEEAIAEEVEDYQITLLQKNGGKETITGKQMGYHYVSGGEVESFLKEQNILQWLFRYFGEPKNYTISAVTDYDEAMLQQSMEKLSCFSEEKVTAPKDAALTKLDNGTYQVTPETEGNLLKKDQVFELLKQAADTGGKEIDLAAADCYEKPKIYADDQALNAKAATLNQYASMKVTYYMGGDTVVVLDPATINSWMTLDENQQPVFDREAVQSYVAQLAADYDTIGTWPPFTTSLGETVYVEARTYGWQINQEQETEELYQILLAGASVERSPVYYESAVTRGANDIGDTYVEIDYTNQRMWFYKDGVLLVDTPVVTGCVANGTASPEGIFCLVGKSEDEVLRGEGYATPVEYWMPFYGGVGIHDADSWRSSYGGDIYQYSGSHGCINTPTANAAIIYQNIEPGTPIICYSASVNLGQGSTGIQENLGGQNEDGQTGENENADWDDQTGQSGNGDWDDQTGGIVEITDPMEEGAWPSGEVSQEDPSGSTGGASADEEIIVIG